MMQKNSAINILPAWREIAQRFALALLLIAIFLLPFSSHWMNQFIISSAIVGLFGWSFTERLAQLREQRSIVYALLFFLVVLIGVTYTRGSMHDALHAVGVYAKIFYLILFFPFFVEQRAREVVLHAYLAGLFLSLVLLVLGVVQQTFVNAIDISFMTGFACYVLARRFLDGGRWRWVYAALFIFMTSFLLLYNTERTGYVVFFGVMCILFWQSLSWRGLLAGFFLMMASFTALYFFTPVVNHTVNNALNEAQHYFATSNHQGSIGLRLGFVEYSWQAIKPHLWLGNGTGSFIEVYKATGGPLLETGVLPHPHNQYVMVLFQFGLIGLAIFLLWQLVIWIESFQLPLQEQRLLQALLVSFVLLGFCNVSLDVNPPGNVFVILCTVFLSAKREDNK